jgi:uncharacterized membrane protein YgcG
MGRTNKIALISAAVIVAIASASPALAARKRCVDYVIHDSRGPRTCAWLCEILTGLRSSTDRVGYWQNVVTGQPTRITTRTRTDFLPNQVTDVASCQDTTPPGTPSGADCSFKVCVLVVAPYERDVNRIPRLQPIPKPKFGPPPVGQGTGAMSPGLLDGDSGFAAAGPAGTGSGGGGAAGGGGGGGGGIARTYGVSPNIRSFGAPSGGSSGGLK